MINEIDTADVVVRDGSTVCVRRTTPDDLDGLRQFFDSLSVESLYYRFLGLAALAYLGLMVPLGLGILALDGTSGAAGIGGIWAGVAAWMVVRAAVNRRRTVHLLP